MHLTREDMLRELELLPVWRARIPAAMSLQTELPAQQVRLVTEATVAPAVESVQSPEMAPVVGGASFDTQAPMAESSLTAFPDEVLVKTPWLLYCPQAGDIQSQQLLQNIVVSSTMLIYAMNF